MQAAAPAAAGPVKKWLAQYDYTAADADEVSFADGDTIIDVEVIDEGWVKGTVEKSGERGMIPSNYVEEAPADAAAEVTEAAAPEPAAEEAAPEPAAEEPGRAGLHPARLSRFREC